MYKILGVLSAFATLALVAMPAVATAHVTVKPAQAGIGSYQTFTTNVPVEKNMPTVGIRLVIPAGLQYVQPNVKPGWTIDEKTSGGGDFPTITEISWTGGSIPAGQRDEFNFAAQVPAKATSLDWKAYQTYADGSVVSWDQNPTGKEDDGSTPYSITKVVNDLTPKGASSSTDNTKSNDTLGLVFGIIAILISVGGVLSRRKG